MLNNVRYNDYYLVNDEDIDDVMYAEDFERRKGIINKRCMIWTISIIVLVLFLGFLLVFVVFPLIFMNSIAVQRMLVFTHFNLPSTRSYFEEYHLPGYRNKYISVKDLDNKSNRTLGLWHILPVEFTYKALHNASYDYEEALRSSNYSVLLYFHGTGEDRSDSRRKYQLLRYYFHIVAFDYRSYADSSKGDLSEPQVVNDCQQIYKWLKSKTDSSIYVWGHSLGAALVASTLAKYDTVKPSGLILEAPFTSLKDELYVHPYGKFFAWLPWFKVMILDPLEKNGMIFDTKKNIETVESPIMLLHAQDDSVVPYQMSKKLYEIASNRKSDEFNTSTTLHVFNKTLRYDHFFIYQDPFLEFYLMDFLLICNNQSKNGTLVKDEQIKI